ncbi:MAG: hypothetical protein CMH30_09015 [Micavibrio sp.]|nr:hypothetical protein [Micavibrio sp.]|tara:strand:+ start:1608 stop:3014 length:1407 start_codon:yes stop_codon:yes gene_type:complete
MRFSKVFLVMGLVVSAASINLNEAQAGFEFVAPMANYNQSGQMGQQINRIPPTQPIVQNTLPVVMAPSRAQDNYYRQQSQQAYQQPVQQMQMAPVMQQPQQQYQPQPQMMQPASMPFSSTEPQPLRAQMAQQPVMEAPAQQPMQMQQMAAPQAVTSIPVYSEVAVEGDAFAPSISRRRAEEEKKRSIVSLNPFPFGLTAKPSEQKGFLFGRPVPSSASAPIPATGFSGPYMNNSMPRASVQTATLAAPQRMQPIVSQQMDAPAGSYAVAVGFGKGMPLPIALSQIVPSDYSLIYAEGVDVSQTVSWEGGKPWNQVLDSMLAPKNLTASIAGKTVQIMPSATRHSALENFGSNKTVSSALYALDNLNERSSVEMVDYDTTIKTWTAPRNLTLRQVLESWSKEAGVQLYWRADYDYPLESDVSLQGTFEEVVEVLLKGFSEAQPRPIARLHPNEPDGPAVIVIETRHIIR